MPFLYTLLWYLLLPFLFLRLLFRSRLAPDYRKRWHERLAFNYRQPKLKQCVWLHAVSVGEFLAAAPLIDILLKKYPNTPFLVTTTTPTGSARVKDRLGNRVHHVYCPWELPDALNRFMRHFNPKLGIIMETELWPNLTRVAYKHNCKLVLANGRLSANSHKGYAKLPSLVKPLLSRFSAFAIQATADAERFISLGATQDNVHIIGSIKFDLSISEALKQQAANEKAALGSRPIWIAASTHPPEEAQIIAAHQQLLSPLANALLIWVPRHPERFDNIANQLTEAKLNFARRSKQEAVTEATQVYLADTMGELLLLYGVADIAFVGGSLDATLGGHNLLEPAAWAKPVLSGTHLTNFKAIAELLTDAQALTLVNNSDELATQLHTLFASPASQQQLGQAAQQVVQNNQGALKKLVALIEQFWPSDS